MSKRVRAPFCAPLTIFLALLATGAVAQSANRDDNSGPYNVTILEGGEGLTRALSSATASLEANAPWSMSGWVNPKHEQSGPAVLLAVGKSQEDGRALMLDGGTLSLWAGGQLLKSRGAATPGIWSAIAATFDGKTARLYVDGTEVASQELQVGAAAAQLNVATVAPQGINMPHFGGQLAQLTLHRRALTADQVQSLYKARPDFGVIVFHEVGGHWPWQVKQWRGLQEPQDPWTLPHGKAPFSKPVAKAAAAKPALMPAGAGVWNLTSWKLAAAPTVTSLPADISGANYSDAAWYAATVPGTVLTTLIDRGVYPDYDYGLNNMAIPESLARQDYWYRTAFDAPADLDGKQLTLTFKGINYAAEVWINGAKLGNIRGAFIRGVFDVTGRLALSKRNVIAVRVSPPPHPGIPHEESIAAGPGENGGWVALDGPTFAASEGWDWIPGIRDRNTGIWQDVTLSATGRVRLLDPQVITRLPLPKTDSAEVSIMVPVDSSHTAPVEVTVTAKFEGVSLSKTATVGPGRTEVQFTAAQFPQLNVANARLWWPNGYGAPELYHLELAVSDGGHPSDTKSLRFGIRHITYDFSLFDSDGRLRRVEVDVAQGSARGERLIDNRHEAIKKSPRGWAASLTKAGETSPAVRELPPSGVSPHLTLRVNGVPILARGGNWGMDDSRKRIDRARLEPYFKLQKAANLNIVRNWMGNNDEDVFFDLCDEYGLMILNDFWASTQDFQVEPQDPQLFLANAEDTVQRYRNHPSIVLWFGRNEGVPQPILNEGLGDLIARLDGTRHFTGSSNMVNLQGSGPYNYRPPVGYFQNLASGFSVETGTPSLATLEAIQAMVPAEDRWPLSDTIAYHDWHFGGNGDIKTFMETLATRYGEGTSLEDFERKAQMMNYETYRAVFEGLQAHLWTQNSGRLLWMTHPAWPSNHWQIYTSDYDTHASYYGVKKAVEPVHAQMNLPDLSLTVVNTTREARTGLQLTTQVLSLDNRVLASRDDSVNAAANDITSLPVLNILDLVNQEGMVLVTLRLRDAAGALISDNTYWQGKDDASHQKLNALSQQKLALKATGTTVGNERVISVQVVNNGKQAALAAKLTLVDAKGDRILPALYSDNYLTVLPGEPKTVEIRYPDKFGNVAQLKVRGWNVKSDVVRVNAVRIAAATAATLQPER
jgi:Exo-beta-D-glucosaminidase Ig-fold domain/Concanavalin A-like lectin/glucanases superfamily/Glycosyl hydrolases family 2/Glycosyl hydrolases family 2, TIM barrel domain/Glycosyl hydrolases family 2, sugar binding domain